MNVKLAGEMERYIDSCILKQLATLSKKIVTCLSRVENIDEVNIESLYPAIEDCVTVFQYKVVGAVIESLAKKTLIGRDTKSRLKWIKEQYHVAIPARR